MHAQQTRVGGHHEADLRGAFSEGWQPLLPSPPREYPLVPRARFSEGFWETLRRFRSIGRRDAATA